MGIQEFFRNVRELAVEGLSLADCGRVLGTLAKIAVSIAEQYETTGSTKKAWVMARVTDLLDVIVPAIPLPVWAAPFGPLIRSLAKRCLLAMADGMVEAAVDALHANV